MFSIISQHSRILTRSISTFKFGEAMFFHEKISLFPNPWKFSFFCLFDGIGFSIYFRNTSKNGGKIACPQVLNFIELVHPTQVFFFDWLFLTRWFRTNQFMCRPVFFLTINPTVKNILASSTPEQFFLRYLTCLADLLFSRRTFHYLKTLYFLNHKNQLIYQFSY